MGFKTWIQKHLSRRLLFYLMPVLAVQIILTGVISYSWIYSYVEEIMVSKTMEVNKSLVQEVNYIRNNYEIHASRIMANQSVQDILKKSYSTDSLVEQYVEDRRAVEWALMDPENKLSSVLISNNQVMYQTITQTAYQAPSSIHEVRESEIYEKSLESDGNNIWLPLKEDFKGNQTTPYLYLLKSINQITYDYRRLGQLMIQIPLDTLDGVFKRNGLAENEYFAIIDDSGCYMYHSLDKTLVGEQLEESLRFVLKAKESMNQTIDSERFMLYYSPYENRLNKSGWNVLHVVPTRIASTYTSAIQYLCLGIMLFLLFLSTPLFIILFGGVAKPIVELDEAVSALGGSLETRIPVDRHDEIGNLQESFNKMADDIIQLLVGTAEKSKRLQKMEFDALEYQINPHFLYNSLDSIYWMAKKAGNEDVSLMVMSLARFYRVGLSNGQDVYCIRDELEHVRQYLTINKLRFKESFNFEIEAEPMVLERPMLKIILQPIVENAIKHGVDKKETTGFIRVSVHEEGNDIIFAVSDNGPGLPEHRVQAIEGALQKHELSDNADGGFGMYNVYQRLWLHYGEGIELKLESKPGEGTIVRIRIPHNAQI